MSAISATPQCVDEQAEVSSITSLVVDVEHAIVCVCPHGDTLLAGADDGVVMCWQGGNIWQSDKPHSQLQLQLTESVNTICYLHKNVWGVGCGDRLVLLLTNEDKALSLVNTIQFEDELNSIAVNDKQTFAAVVDDTGCLTLIDLKTYKVHKKLLGHETICSCVKFRPKSPWSVLTGGLDSLIILWDFKKGLALASVNMSDEVRKVEEKEDKSSYVVNPPLVHCLDISDDGLIAAAGLENGKVMLFTIGGKGLKLASMIDAHSQGVSTVCIKEDMSLLTAGNDSRINIWTLSTARAPGKTLVWAVQQQTILHTGKPSHIHTMQKLRKVFVADETNRLTLYSY